jgi:sulfite reductase (ferredoxin)
MFYEIPANLPSEIAELEGYIGAFQRGEIDAASLKSRRVPFGCYEQRRDGAYMVRIRATGGAVTPVQLKAIAEAAARLGNGIVHITTREEFQIHDIALERVTTAMRALLAAGLSSRGGGGNTVRNIQVSPGAGVAPDEVFDPSPHAFALTSRLIAEADSWTLPRKLKIAFSNSPADTAFARFNDLGFVAKIENGRRGFRVFVAGGFGGKPELGHELFAFIPEGDVYIVAETVKRLFDKTGNRRNRNLARLRFLWRKLGEAGFRELYAKEEAAVRASGPAPFVPAVLPENATAAVIAPVALPGQAFDLWKSRFVIAQKQPGLFSVLIPASLGNIRSKDAIALVEFLALLGQDVLRGALAQNLRLRNIPENLLGNVFALVRDFDPLAAAPRLLANSIACTGADTCKLGICMPKGALAAIARALGKSGLPLDAIGDFRLNLSGCPNSCGQHVLADLGFFGNAGRKEDETSKRLYPAYAIVAGARIGGGEARLAKSFGRIAARDLPDFVVALLKTWLEKKSRFASFAAYIDGEGAADIAALEQRFAEIPAFEDDKNYYYDWGAESQFSLVGRGVGECSAGLFDLIDLDLTEADRLAARQHDRETVYRLALRTCRALLITRGIEAGSEADVFAAFGKHFIAAGLVPEHYAAAVAAAQRGDLDTLLAQEAGILKLLDEVKTLYASMDNSLRFPAETGTVAAPPPVLKADIERDYRAVMCPGNYVKVRNDLATIAVGQRLRVILADGEPIQSVPHSIALEGHKILKQERLGEVWEVVIEKGR